MIRLRVLALTSLAACAAGALAGDYALTISSDSVKNARTLLLYGTGNRLKAGDRIVRVFFEPDLRGAPCMVASGRAGPSTMPVAGAGNAEGFLGEIRISNDPAPERAVEASLALVPEVIQPIIGGVQQRGSSVKDVVKETPWIMWMMAAGLVLLAAIAAWLIFFRGEGGGKGFKGVGAGAAELRALKDQLTKISNKMESLSEGGHAKDMQRELKALMTALQESSGRGAAINADSAHYGAIKAKLDELGFKFDKSGTKLLEIQSILAAGGGGGGGGEGGSINMQPLVEELTRGFASLESKVQTLSGGLEAVRASVSHVSTGKGGGGSVDLRPVIEGIRATQDAAQEHWSAVAASLVQISAKVQEGGHSGGGDSKSLSGLRDALGKSHEMLQNQIEQLGKGLSRVEEAIESIPAQSGGKADGDAAKAITAIGRTLQDVHTKMETIAPRMESIEKQMSWVSHTLEGAPIDSKSHSENVARHTEMSKQVSQLADRFENAERVLVELGKTAKAPAEAFSIDWTPILERVESIVKKEASAASSSKATEAVLDQVSLLSKKQDVLETVLAGLRNEMSAILASGGKGGEIPPEVLKALSSGGGDVTELSQKITALAASIDHSRKWQESAQNTLDNLASALKDSAQKNGEPSTADLKTAIQALDTKTTALEASLRQLGSKPGVAGAAPDDSVLIHRIEALEFRISGEIESILQGLSKLETGRGPSRPVSAPEVSSGPGVIGEEYKPVSTKHYTIDAGPGRAAKESVGEMSVTGDEEEEEQTNTFEQYIASGDGKRVTPWQWLAQGGSAERHASGESRQILVIDRNAPVPRAITPTDTPDAAHKIGQVLFSLGFVVYAHGDTIRGFWPGKEPKSVPLLDPLPPEPWRMLSHAGRLYCALGSRVEIVHLGLWAKVGGFEGMFVDQLYAGKNWVGLRNVGNQIEVEYREDTGKAAKDSVKVKVNPNDFLMSASGGEEVFIATKHGKVFRVQKDSKQIFPTGKTDVSNIHYMAVHNNTLIVLHEKRGGLGVKRIDFGGKPIADFDVDVVKHAENPVIMGDHLYVIDESGPTAIVCDLNKQKVVKRVRMPDLSEAHRVCGLHDGEQKLLIFIGVDAGGQTGHAVVFEPETGYELKLCAVGIHNHVVVIPAESKIVVATSNDYQNIIRVFDPFAGTWESSKAA